MVVINPKNGKVQAQIAKMKEVQAVVPDLEMRMIDPMEMNGKEVSPESIGDDEKYFGYQWNMFAISAPDAWDAGYTGEGARVFILDSGIDADNPDLKPNLNTTLSTSFVAEETYDVANGFNHGTHVAGIIAAADNKWGVIGVAPKAELVAVKVLSEVTGSGSFSNITRGIIYAALYDADVINMSLGALVNRNGNYMDEDGNWHQGPANLYQAVITAQQRAVNFAVQKGAVVVTSAGNDEFNGDGSGSFYKIPADLQGVIAVSATAPQCWVFYEAPNFDLPASYTNYGKSLVALAAPGGDAVCEDGYPYDMILSNGAGGPSYGFYFSAGTSMAAPHVAGVAALIIGKNGGEMNPAAVKQQLFKTADKIDGNGISAIYGNGRVNAYRAVTE